MMKSKLTVLLMMVLLALGGCTKQVISHHPGQNTSPSGQTLHHTVVAGETLRQIAANYYGDADFSKAIASMNGITDPDRIVPGSVLVLEFDEKHWSGVRQRSVALEAYNKGVDMMGQDRLAEAEKQFRLALDTAPDLESASYNLALVLAGRGKNSEALIILDELTVSHAENIDFHFARGHNLFMLARFSDAVLEFEKVIALDSTDKRAIFSLARSLQEDGQKDRAGQTWQRYLDLDSTSSWADSARQNLKKLHNGS